MNKKVVLGIVAGVTAVGGVTGIVVRSIKRLHAAKKYYDDAGRLVERAEDLTEEANELLDRAQVLVDYVDEELDGFDDLEDIVEFPKGAK